MRIAPSPNTVVEFTKPDRLDNPAEFLADDFEDEDIQSAVDELAPICDGFRRHSFAWYYDVGKIVRNHYETLQQERTSMYGQRFFNRLAQDLHRPNVNGQLLAHCYRLVRRYTEVEYLKFAQQAAVSPTHLLLLGGIEDRPCRDELIQAVIAQNLTTEQLQRAIMEKVGLRHKGNPGRPLKVPANVTAGLTHVETQAGKIIKLSSEVWFGDAFDLVEEISTLPADKLTDTFRTQLAATADQVENVAKVMSNNAEALRTALAEVDRRRQAQAEYESNLQHVIAADEGREREVQVDSQDQRVSATPHRRPTAGREIGRAARVA